jgi:hypothetical protein
VSAGLALVLAAIGCNSEPNYPRAPVEGTVSLDGKPLAGVVVTFYPVSDGSRGLPTATATTDSAGKYRVGTTDKDGVIVGKNRVVVNWPPRERTDERDKAAAPRPPVAIPVRYTVASQTPFVVDVNAGNGQTINLPLDAR